MNPRLFAAAIGLALVIGGLGALAGLDSCRKAQGHDSEIQSSIHVGEADVHQHNAEAQDAAVSDLKAQLKAREADLGRLNAERDALLKRLAAKPKPHVDPASPAGAVGPDDSEPVSNANELALLRETVAKDAEVIEGQQLLIKSQSELILVATKRGDEYRAAFESERKARQAQEAATQAWKSAVTTSKWRGRLEGFAAGVALGFVGGKR
jgi:hypothetical protein